MEFNWSKLTISLLIFLALPLICQAGLISNPIRDIAITAGLMPGAGLPLPLSYRIGLVVNGLLGFLGILFFVLILYGGFLWMTAGGNEEQVTKARKLVTNSVIGLLIVLLAYAITLGVLNVIFRAQEIPY